MPQRNLPNFSEERRLWKKGYKFVAGVDEVGRGAWAGPIVAAAVVFSAGPATDKRRVLPLASPSAIPPANKHGAPSLVPPGSRHPSHILKAGINDSKQLRPRQRENLANFIKENVFAWGIGEVPASVINRIGMAKATKKAFRRAISATNAKLDFLLIDAFYIPYIKGLRRKRQKAIIDGDEKSISIAAASILAKVYRDKLMKKLAREYKVYGWARNKGYGTRQHQRAIKKHGLTRYHRKAFVETWREKERA